MPKKKRQKYSFLAEQKRIENQEREHLLDPFKEDRDLANAFLNDYTSKFPQLYQSFQEQLEASIPGCIYIRIDKKKTNQQGMPLHVYFAPKSFLEESLKNSHPHPARENLLNSIEVWQQEHQHVPLAIHVGSWLEATTFPVLASQKIIDCLPLTLTSSPDEFPHNLDSPSL